ncbi:hypothetical protein ACOME3_005252 [Neoechinorhynchus agilis]
MSLTNISSSNEIPNSDSLATTTPTANPEELKMLNGTASTQGSSSTTTSIEEVNIEGISLSDAGSQSESTKSCVKYTYICYHCGSESLLPAGIKGACRRCFGQTLSKTRVYPPTIYKGR